MKICVIVGAFPSLSETFILNQLTGLLDRGHELIVFAGARSADVVVHEDVIRSGLLRRVRFHNDKPRHPLARFLVFLARLPRALLCNPMVVLRSLDVFKYRAEAWSLNLFFKAQCFLEARDAEIVYCHFGMNGLTGLCMKELGALTGKLLTVFHAADISAYVERHGDGVYRRLFEVGDRFLPVSEHARQKLMIMGCRPELIAVHRMGVDLAQFSGEIRKRFASGPLRLLSVARLVEKKGLSFAMEALALLAKEGLSWEYTLVGDGPLRPALESQARSLGISSRVRFCGWQDSGAVRRYLKDADIFLAPSIRAANGDEEGIPVVLMEAMASRVPVITTPTGAIGELVLDGRTGFWVDPGNAADLAACVRRVWHDPVSAERAADGGRRMIEEHYESGVLNKQLINLFKVVAYGK